MLQYSEARWASGAALAVGGLWREGDGEGTDVLGSIPTCSSRSLLPKNNLGECLALNSPFT